MPFSFLTLLCILLAHCVLYCTYNERSKIFWKENSPNHQYRTNENSASNLDPPHPLRAGRYGQHQHYDGSYRAIVGYVLAKGGASSNPWAQIYSPLLETSYYAQGKEISKLPRFCMTSSCQTDKIYIERQWRPGVTQVDLLTQPMVAEANEEHKDEQGNVLLQSWLQGTLKSFTFGTKKYALDVSIGIKGRPGRFFFDVSTLSQGSLILPPGTPVFFQTCFQQDKGRDPLKGTTQISSLIYDWTQYATHAGIFPSRVLLDNIESKLGAAHIIVGCSSLVDVRAVSFLDLVEDDDDPLDQIALNSLLIRAFDVLKTRLSRLKADTALALADPLHSTHIARLEHSITALNDNTPLVIYVIPNFHPRKTWLTLINRHFNNKIQGDIDILKVRMLNMVGAGLNPNSLGREAGLISRLVDEWRVGDYQEAHQLFRNAGPFAQLVPGGALEVQDHGP